MQISADGKPWTLQLSGLCIETLRTLQRLREPDLERLTVSISRIQAAVDRVCYCTQALTSAGWLWRLASNQPGLEEVEAAHIELKEVR